MLIGGFTWNEPDLLGNFDRQAVGAAIVISLSKISGTSPDVYCLMVISFSRVMTVKLFFKLFKRKRD